MPLGVFVDEVPLSVEGVGRGVVVRVECVQLAHVQHGGAQVGRSVCERAMRPVLGAEAARVRVVYAHASFVVAQVISSLRVACCTMQERTLVSVFANARRLVVLRTVIVRAIVEGPVSFSNRSASPLIIKMPMKTRKRPVLCTFMLEKRWTLLHSEFF